MAQVLLPTTPVDAEREFREVLRLEPGNRAAADNLEKLAQARASAVSRP